MASYDAEWCNQIVIVGMSGRVSSACTVRIYGYMYTTTTFTRCDIMNVMNGKHLKGKRAAHIMVANTMWEELRIIAKVHGITISELVRQGAYRLIERYYDNAVKTLEDKKRPNIDEVDNTSVK